MNTCKPIRTQAGYFAGLRVGLIALSLLLPTLFGFSGTVSKRMANGSANQNTGSGIFSESAKQISDSQSDMILWYRNPAVQWLDGMPIGNGYMGAMAFGRTGVERIALNESSFWSGGPHDYNDPNAYSYFPKIRDLVFAQKFQEAEKMADEHFWGIPAA